MAVVWGSPRLTKLEQTSFIVIASRIITQDDFGVVRIPDLSQSSGIVYTKKSDQKIVVRNTSVSLKLPDMTKDGPFFGLCIPPPPLEMANAKDSFLMIIL